MMRVIPLITIVTVMAVLMVPAQAGILVTVILPIEAIAEDTKYCERNNTSGMNIPWWKVFQI